MDIEQLIADIRELQAAQVDFEPTRRDWDSINYGKREACREAKERLNSASHKVTGEYIGAEDMSGVVSSFVALADEVERLQMERQSILNICTLQGVYVGNFYKDAVKAIRALLSPKA